MINPSYIKNATVEPFPDIRPWQKVVAKIKANFIVFIWGAVGFRIYTWLWKLRRKDGADDAAD